MGPRFRYAIFYKMVLHCNQDNIVSAKIKTLVSSNEVEKKLEKIAKELVTKTTNQQIKKQI